MNEDNAPSPEKESGAVNVGKSENAAARAEKKHNNARRAEKREKNAERARKKAELSARRLAAFENTCSELRAKGYVQKDRTFSVLAANGWAVLLMLPVLAAAIIWFVLTASEPRFSLPGAGWALLAMAVSLPVHEGLHALGWAAVNRTCKGIRFGVSEGSLYCACALPMRRGGYLLGSLLPLLLLGVGITLAGIFTGSVWLFAVGLFNLFAAGGDALVALQALFTGRGVRFLLDHPARCGFFAFTKPRA